LSYRQKQRQPTNAPAAQLRLFAHELAYAGEGVAVSAQKPKEMVMELFAGVPDWLVWCTAGGAGAIALANIAIILEAVLELDAC
jgi:hypothetical protein